MRRGRWSGIQTLGGIPRWLQLHLFHATHQFVLPNRYTWAFSDLFLFQKCRFYSPHTILMNSRWGWRALRRGITGVRGGITFWANYWVGPVDPWLTGTPRLIFIHYYGSFLPFILGAEILRTSYDTNDLKVTSSVIVATHCGRIVAKVVCGAWCLGGCQASSHSYT